MITSAEVQEMERRFNERMATMEGLCQNNTAAIAKLTASQNRLTANLETLTKSTQGIVDVWSAGRTLQAAVKWLSGFSFIAAIIAWWTGKI